MLDRITGLSLSALVPSLIVIALAGAPPSQAVDPSATTLDTDALAQIAPALPQIVNLALLDPQLAAEMVPDAWLDSALESARVVAGERPRERRGKTVPTSWPVGPWSSASSMASSIHALDPTATAALYGALEPRLTRRCQARGASFARCEQELRTTLERLSSPVVTARVAGDDEAPITDTQLEFARLGAQVVTAGRAKIEAVTTAVWPARR